MESKCDYGLYTSTNMKCAIADANATMTSLTITSTKARDETRKEIETCQKEITARDFYINFSRKSNKHVKCPSAHTDNLVMHVPFKETNLWLE